MEYTREQILKNKINPDGAKSTVSTSDAILEAMSEYAAQRAAILAISFAEWIRKTSDIYFGENDSKDDEYRFTYEYNDTPMTTEQLFNLFIKEYEK